jgi:hypothetical protein
VGRPWLPWRPRKCDHVEAPPSRPASDLGSRAVAPGLVPASSQETQKATRTAITLTALTRWAAIPRRTSDGSPERMTSRRARRPT